MRINFNFLINYSNLLNWLILPHSPLLWTHLTLYGHFIWNVTLLTCWNSSLCVFKYWEQSYSSGSSIQSSDGLVFCEMLGTCNLLRAVYKCIEKLSACGKDSTESFQVSTLRANHICRLFQMTRLVRATCSQMDTVWCKKEGWTSITQTKMERDGKPGKRSATKLCVCITGSPGN